MPPGHLGLKVKTFWNSRDFFWQLRLKHSKIKFPRCASCSLYGVHRACKGFQSPKDNVIYVFILEIFISEFLSLLLPKSENFLEKIIYFFQGSFGFSALKKARYHLNKKCVYMLGNLGKWAKFNSNFVDLSPPQLSLPLVPSPSSCTICGLNNTMPSDSSKVQISPAD